jgi:energy-converting hydrogenase Eha subunit G
MALEMTGLFAVAALCTEKSRTDDLAVRPRAVLDKVAVVALFVLASVKADLAEGLLRLTRLVWATIPG